MGTITVDAGALNRDLVLENDVVFGSVNANRRHYEAAAEALAAFGVAGEDAAAGATGPGTFHTGLYDALYNLDPRNLDARASIE